MGSVSPCNVRWLNDVSSAQLSSALGGGAAGCLHHVVTQVFKFWPLSFPQSVCVCVSIVWQCVYAMHTVRSHIVSPVLELMVNAYQVTKFIHVPMQLYDMCMYVCVCVWGEYLTAAIPFYLHTPERVVIMKTG